MGEKGKFVYDYWRPAVTVDNVVFSFDGNHLMVLLIRRKNEPFQNQWAFPGGFLDENETLEDAAQRELREETGVSAKYFTQIGTFSKLNRDPRGRTISTAFASVVRFRDAHVAAGDDAKEACWFSVGEMPILAFDHEEIFRKALWMLRIGFLNAPIAFMLLDDIFTLPDMQRLFTDVYGHEFDRRNFQKKFLSSGILTPVLEDDEKKNSHSPAHYRFNEGGYVQFRNKQMKF